MGRERGKKKKKKTNKRGEEETQRTYERSQGSQEIKKNEAID